VPAAGPVASRIPELPNQPADNGPWSFRYKSDTVSYQIRRSAVVENETDSVRHRESTTNSTHLALSLALFADTVSYTAVIDTFSTATQGLIGSAQQVIVPVEISGVVQSIGSAQSDSTEPIQSCDPARASLQSDVRNLLINFPSELSPGLVWSDSTTRTTCYGRIPMKASVVRRFSVLGKTSHNGQSVVAIQRSDSITAHGEGQQQQHRLTIDATGDGSATYYLAVEQSSVLHLTTDQNVELVIRSASQTARFRENAKQDYSLLR